MRQMSNIKQKKRTKGVVLLFSAKCSALDYSMQFVRKSDPKKSKSTLFVNRAHGTKEGNHHF